LLRSGDQQISTVEVINEQEPVGAKKLGSQQFSALFEVAGN
jgi:hypothetical protein